MNESNEFRTGRHCVFALHDRLVFVTKYRYKVLEKYMRLTLRRLFEKVCHGFEAERNVMGKKTTYIFSFATHPKSAGVLRAS